MDELSKIMQRRFFIAVCDNGFGMEYGIFKAIW